MRIKAILITVLVATNLLAKHPVDMAIDFGNKVIETEQWALDTILPIADSVNAEILSAADSAATYVQETYDAAPNLWNGAAIFVFFASAATVTYKFLYPSRSRIADGTPGAKPEAAIIPAAKAVVEGIAGGQGGGDAGAAVPSAEALSVTQAMREGYLAYDADPPPAYPGFSGAEALSVTQIFREGMDPYAGMPAGGLSDDEIARAWQLYDDIIANGGSAEAPNF